MALDSYSNLKAELLSLMHRQDLSPQADTAIDLCESQMNRELRTIKQEVRSTGAIDTQYVMLPDDFLELRNIQLNTSPIQILRYLSPEAMDSLGVTTGRPIYYTFVGNELQLAPTPAGEYTVEIDYFSKIPALSDANTTNFVLVNWPELYLYGSLAHLAMFIMDETRAAGYQGVFLDAMGRVKAQDKKARYNGNAMAPRVL